MYMNKKVSDFEKKLKAIGLSPEEINNKVAIFKKLQESTKIPSKEILRRAFQIKPVFLDEANCKLHWMEGPDICFESFIIYPDLNQPANGLKELHTFQTYHVDGGNPELLRPTVQEVLEQIPEEYLDETVAFETFFNLEKVKYDEHLERHQLFTRIYKGKIPENIAGQPVKCKGKIYRVYPF